MASKRRRTDASAGPARLRGIPRGYRRDRDCVTCKARSVKCDLNRPSCGPCEADGVPCQGFENRVRWAPYHVGSPAGVRPLPASVIHHEADRETHNVADVAKGRRDWLCGQDSNWTTHYDKYLDFFVTKFNEAQAVCNHLDTPNHSLADVWQLVWRRTAGHLHSGDSIDMDSLRLHIAALRGINHATENGDIFAVFGIVTFAFLDVYEGSFGDWQQHLRGARALLDLHCPDRDRLIAAYDQVPGLRQAVSLLVWYDIMGTFLRRRGSTTFEDWHRAGMDDEFFRLVHCPKDTFELYILIIQARQEGSSDSLHLLTMQQLLLCTKDPQPTQDGVDMLENAWRYAAVMAATELSRSHQAPGFAETMNALADKICTTVKAIPPGSGRYHHLACAVSVLGANAKHSSHLEIVDTYWATCRVLNSPIYPNGRKATLGYSNT